MRRWIFRCSARLNDLLHSLQWCCFSPLWVSRCWLRLDFVIDEKSQNLHWFGFSKECVLMCLSRVPASEDAKSHCVHVCGFFPSWVSMCIFRIKGRANEFCISVYLLIRVCYHMIPQRSYSSKCPIWVSMCLFRLPASPNAILQWTHLFAFSLVSLQMSCLTK